MLRRRLCAVLAALSLTAAVVFPASAGGWATVEPDDLLGSVEAGQSIALGFTVLQHGDKPYDEAEPVLTATHRESGEVIEVTAVKDGGPGHYVAEITFPTEGDWVLSVAPFPFPSPTSLPTLSVLAPGSLGGAPGGGEFGAAVVPRCGGTAAAIFDLENFDLPDTLMLDGSTDPNPILRSESVLPITLSDLIASRPAIATGAAIDTSLACGQILGQPLDGELIVGLSETDGSGYVGIARITEENGQSVVSVYLAPGLTTASTSEPSSATIPSTSKVVIEGSAFGPASVQVQVGTAVTWINHDPIGHEIAFQDIALDDSGLLDPGQEFTQYFLTPGTYSYVCGPHAGMTGTIVVL